MKLSIIVATRNGADTIRACLDFIAAAYARAAPLAAEIVAVDNGSTDNTPEIIEAWARASSVPVKFLSEPRAGKGRALNRALRAAEGDRLAFTDDDCRLHVEYVNDWLRHDAGDAGLVVRGGRIELGDPNDLPLTINTSPMLQRWSLASNSARYAPMMGCIPGCNLIMRRALVDQLGPFDEDFGPGSRIGSGEDSDYLFRAYLAGATLEYVPDMIVYHDHGRKTNAEGRALFCRYLIGVGALYAKFFWRHPNFCRNFYWDLRKAIREIITGTNTCMPSLDFSHGDRVIYAARGAIRYFFMRKDRSARRLWDAEREALLFSSSASRRIEALEAQGYRLDHRDGDQYFFQRPAE